MTPGDCLRMAADAVDDYALGERKARVIKLLAFHVIRLCGGSARDEETRVFIELIDD